MKDILFPEWLKKTLGYILVAALSSAVTLTACSLRGVGQTKLEQLESLILDRYIGEVDATVLEDSAAVGMVAGTGDKWSYYVSAEEYESYNQGKRNAYVGIGVTASRADYSRGLEVLRVEESGGAAQAGIQAGDWIVGVDGHTLEEVGGEAMSGYIGGDAGTTVEITVLRDGKTLTFTVERRQLNSRVVSYRMLPGKVGYVRIFNFNDRSADESIAAVKTLCEQGATGLLFDVRGNPGGYKHELVALLNYLLPEGILFQTVDYEGTEIVDRSDADCLEMPMAVLINGDSYSAAEFFAAALEEYGWAELAGEPTTGKGYYQHTVRLNDGSAVTLSMGKYFTPNGVSLAETGGLDPKLLVEVDAETRAKIYADTLPVEEDAQIQAALTLFPGK